MFVLGALLAATSFVRLAHAQIVQDDWIYPPAKQNAITLMNGETVKFQWTDALKDWFGDYCPDCDTGNLDFWLDGPKDYKISEGVDVKTTTELDWKVEIDSKLDANSDWVLRFIPSGRSITDIEGNEISSAVFKIDPEEISPEESMIAETGTATEETATVTAKTDEAAKTTAQTTNAAGSTVFVTAIPTASASATAAPADASQDTSLSGGAKAGIGIGATLGALALIGIGFFLARRMRNKDSAPDETQPALAEHGSPGISTTITAGAGRWDPNNPFPSDRAASYAPTEASRTYTAYGSPYNPVDQQAFAPYPGQGPTPPPPSNLYPGRRPPPNSFPAAELGSPEPAELGGSQTEPVELAGSR